MEDTNGVKDIHPYSSKILVKQIYIHILLCALILFVSVLCESLSLHILPAGGIVVLFFGINAYRLYRIWRKKEYISLLGVCVSVQRVKLRNGYNAAFRMDNGDFLQMFVKGRTEIPIENERYIFVVNKGYKKNNEIRQADIIVWSVW